DGQALQARGEGAWAPAAPIVDPVVRVRRGAQLAEPAEEPLGRRPDGDRAEIRGIRVRHVAVARKRQAPLRLLAPPGVGNRHRRYFLPDSSWRASTAPAARARTFWLHM